MYKHLKKEDPAIWKAIMAETKRQEEGLELIPSEIIASRLLSKLWDRF